jgi:hypothetical protein
MSEQRDFISGDDDAMHWNNNAAPRYFTQMWQSEIEQRETPERELHDSFVDASSLEDMFNETVILSQDDEPADWSVPSALSSVSPPDGSGGRIQFTENDVPIIPDEPLHREADLIDLSPCLAVAASPAVGERARIEEEVYRQLASNTNDIGEQGKNSALDPYAPSQTPSRPDALSLKDRCVTPVRAARQFTASQTPGSPLSPTRSKSEIFSFTYETSAQNPVQSPVPPFVFVHSAGHAKVVVRPTGKPTCVPVSEAGGARCRPFMRRTCVFAVAILLIIAVITIAVGLLTARQMEENRINSDPQSNFPRASTPFPTMTPSIGVPTTPPATTPAPVPSPVFVIPVPGNNDGETLSPVFGPSDPGRTPREETQSPASVVLPTPPPRVPRPSPSPDSISTFAPSRGTETRTPREETPRPVYVPPTRPPRAPTNPPIAPTNPPTPAPTPDRTQREETLAPQQATTVSPRVPLPTPFPTFAPSTSAAPSSFRPTTMIERFVIGLIASASPSSFLALSDIDSPEYMALEWVASDPAVANILYSDSKIVQRWVLAVLFFVTNVDSWYQSDDWLSFTDECTWFSKAAGSICDNNGLLMTLDLKDNGLEGTLPLQISLLPSLRTLNLQNNRLEGIIPQELSLLSNSLSKFVDGYHQPRGKPGSHFFCLFSPVISSRQCHWGQHSN